MSPRSSEPRRVLFLAMSGVRVHAPALRELGLTLPGFVERGDVIASLPSLSLITLAALTPSHWEVAYEEADDALELDWSDYDLVAISSLSARIQDAYVLASQARAAGTSVVLGGLHVSACPDEAATHADAVVVGEGEACWPAVIADFEAGMLAPLYRGQLEDFPTVVPRYDLLDLARYNRVTLQTHRGCPLDCSYCAASPMISRYKRKPIEQVRRELEAICERWSRPFIELADDNTFAHEEHGAAVASLLGEHGVRWFTETDITVADDPKLLDKLAASGCRQLLIGFESARQDGLAQADSRGVKRREWPAYAEKVRRIQSRGISVNGCFVLGFDHDDSRIFDETIGFVERLGLADVQITLLTPFSGTRLHEQLRRQGRLLRSTFWPQCTLFDVTYQPARMSVAELEGGFRELMTSLYCDEATRARRRAFVEQARG